MRGVIPAYHYLLLTINQFVPVRGVILVGVVIYFMCERFVSRAGELFYQYFTKKFLFKSLSPCEGVIPRIYKMTQKILVCPPCGGVIPAVSDAETVQNEFVPVWGVIPIFVVIKSKYD